MTDTFSYKLTLKNFKCFSSYEVEIDHSATILFDGPSGIGKSTLIQAFIFAITGEGKKLFKQGTKSLSVELIVNNTKPFRIVRKKGPESLRVYEFPKEKGEENCYEDDEAQVRINNFFGKNFLNTSIIKQKGESSFLASSAKDKMVFLQALLFSDSTIEKQKDKVVDLIKNCKDEMSKLSVKFSTLKEVLKSKLVSVINSDYEKFEKYSSYSAEKATNKIKTKQEKIKAHNNLVRNTQSKLQEKQSLLVKKTNDEMKYTQLKNRISIFQEQLTDISEKIENIKKDYDEESYDQLVDNINETRNKIRYLKLKTKCDSTQKILSEQINKSLKEVDEELMKIKESEYEEDLYNDYCEKRDLLKKHRDLLKKIEEARYSQDDLDEKVEEMQEIKSFLEKANLYKSSLTCPHCKKCVRLNNTVLEKLDTISDDFSTEKIQQKRQRQKVLETEIIKLENFKKLFEHYTKEDDAITKKLEKYKHISVNKIVELSDLITKMDESRALQVTTKKKKKQLQEEKKRVEAFEHDQLSDDYNKLKKILQQNPQFKSLCNNEEDNLEHYEKTLSELLLKQNSQEKIKDELSALVDKKRNITRDIKTIGTSYEECEDTLEDIIKEIEKINDEIEDMSQKLEELDENNKEDKYNEEISLLEKYKVYLEQLNEKSKIQSDIEDVDKEYKKIEKDCVNYSIILEGIEHAEGVLLSKFIDTINHNLSIHLDAFFEEPMHVQIKPFKESKNNKEKPVINLDIFYKGNETDLTNLSGGEYDRLNLALTLTFNCIANSPVLILDESLSSINQELSTEIIMHIKETISDKLVWMTQHQAVKGMFDRVFQINA